MYTAFNLFTKRFLTSLWLFLAVSTFTISCQIRSNQSEPKANGDSWCTSLKDLIADFPKRCDLGQESESMCIFISKLPTDLSCVLFPNFIRETPPSERIRFLKAFSMMQRASMGKELAFLIPSDVKPRIPETSYVDAYIKAVERVMTLDIPDLSLEIFPKSEKENIYSAVGLKDGRIAFGLFEKLKIAGFNSGKLITGTWTLPTYVASYVRGLFQWNDQLCILNELGFNKLKKSPDYSIECFNNPKSEEKNLTKTISIGLPVTIGAGQVLLKISNENVELEILSDYYEPPFQKAFDCIVNMKLEQVSCKEKGITDDLRKRINYLSPKYGDDVSGAQPERIFEDVDSSRMTAVPILEDLYIGATESGLVSFEKTKEGKFKRIKQSKFPIKSLLCNRSVHKSIQKFNGGYVALDIKIVEWSLRPNSDDFSIKLSFERLLDIWAPVRQPGEIPYQSLLGVP